MLTFFIIIYVLIGIGAWIQTYAEMGAGASFVFGLIWPAGIGAIIAKNVD